MRQIEDGMSDNPYADEKEGPRDQNGDLLRDIDKNEAPMDVGMLALKCLALVVCVLIVLRCIMAPSKTPEPKKANPFEKKKKEKMQKLPKPTSGVKYLYRLARSSEPSRTGLKGVKKKQNDKYDTVGWEAQDMAARPLIFRVNDSGYYGVAGLDDDCLHLSTADTVRKTAELYFKGVDDLLLLKFSTELVEKSEIVELRWEAALPPPGTTARDEAFPHCYSKEKGVKPKMSWWDLVACIPLPIDAKGERVFPKDALSEEDVLPPALLASTSATEPAADEGEDELARLEEEVRREMAEGKS